MGEYLTSQDIRKFAGCLAEASVKPYNEKDFVITIHPFNEPWYQWNWAEDKEKAMQTWYSLRRYGLKVMWQNKPSTLWQMLLTFVS
jgi:hypothetical protein